MAVKTNNTYGEISITDLAIAKFVANAAMECYGIVEFVSCGFFDTIKELINKKSTVKGVKIKTVGDRIYIDVSLIVKYGVSIKAVAESLKEALKYKVERFTGMIVATINVNVLGIKL